MDSSIAVSIFYLILGRYSSSSLSLMKENLIDSGSSFLMASSTKHLLSFFFEFLSRQFRRSILIEDLAFEITLNPMISMGVSSQLRYPLNIFMSNFIFFSSPSSNYLCSTDSIFFISIYFSLVFFLQAFNPRLMVLAQQATFSARVRVLNALWNEGSTTKLFLSPPHIDNNVNVFNSLRILQSMQQMVYWNDLGISLS